MISPLSRVGLGAPTITGLTYFADGSDERTEYKYTPYAAVLYTEAPEIERFKVMEKAKVEDKKDDREIELITTVCRSDPKLLIYLSSHVFGNEGVGLPDIDVFRINLNEATTANGKARDVSAKYFSIQILHQEDYNVMKTGAKIQDQIGDENAMSCIKLIGFSCTNLPCSIVLVL